MSYDQSETTKARLRQAAVEYAASRYPGEFEFRTDWREVFENDTDQLFVMHRGARKRLESSFEYLSDRRSREEITRDAQEAIDHLRRRAVQAVQVFNSGIRAIDEHGSAITPVMASGDDPGAAGHASGPVPCTTRPSGEPETPPKAFISYTWEDRDHIAWVKSFATRLRHNGVEVTLDRWHTAPGDQLPEFMERAIRENDFVLIICTPTYKLKSDERQGGAGYEGDIMTAEVSTQRNRRKFKPVLRKGKWSEAAPTWLQGSRYVDLRGEPFSEEHYEELLDSLHGTQEGPPPVGSRPSGRARPDPTASGVGISGTRDPALTRDLAALGQELTIVNTALVAHDMPRDLREELTAIAKGVETVTTLEAVERLRERLTEVKRRHDQIHESRKPRPRRMF